MTGGVGLIRPDPRQQSPGPDRTTASSWPDASLPTHCSRRRLFQRATGLLRNLTLARAVEKVSDGDSGRSNVASIDREKIPAERLHPKTVYSHCRPIADRDSTKVTAGKLPVGKEVFRCINDEQADVFAALKVKGPTNDLQMNLL